MAVTLYRQVGKGKSRRYQKVNLGRGRRPADLTGPYFLRYSLADGTRPWEHVGDDLDEAIAARERKQAYFEALDANVAVVQDQDDAGRTKITDAVYQWFRRTSALSGQRPTRQEREDAASIQLSSRFLPRLHGAEHPALPRPDRSQAASALPEVPARARERFRRSYSSQCLRNAEHVLADKGHLYRRKNPCGTRLRREAAEALHEAGTQSDVCGHG